MGGLSLKTIALMSLVLATAAISFGQTTMPNTPPPPDTGPATRPSPSPAALTALSDTTLENALAYLRAKSGANIIVNWKALEYAGVPRLARVQITLNKPVTFRRLLTLVLETASPQVPLAYEVEDNVISITTQVEADKHMVTRIYPIDDLLITPVPVAPAKFDLAGGGSGGGSIGNFQSDRQASTLQDEKTARAKTGEEFIQLVITNIRPEIWQQNGGPASIALHNGKLVVTAPLSVHEKLR